MPKRFKAEMTDKETFRKFIVSRLPRYQIGDDYYWSTAQVMEATGLSRVLVNKILHFGLAHRLSLHHRNLYPTQQLVAIWQAGHRFNGRYIKGEFLREKRPLEVKSGFKLTDNGERGSWFRRPEHMHKPYEDIAAMIMSSKGDELLLAKDAPLAKSNNEVYLSLETEEPALHLKGVEYYSTNQVLRITGLKRQYLDNAVKRGWHCPEKMYHKRWYRKRDILGLVNMSREREIDLRRPSTGKKNPEDFYLAMLDNNHLATLATYVETEHDYNLLHSHA